MLDGRSQAAHSYNIAYDYEIGHFDYCTQIDQQGGSCIGKEGVEGDLEPADADDTRCFGPDFSYLVKVTGCIRGRGSFRRTRCTSGGSRRGCSRTCWRLVRT